MIKIFDSTWQQNSPHFWLYLLKTQGYFRTASKNETNGISVFEVRWDIRIKGNMSCIAIIFIYKHLLYFVIMHCTLLGLTFQNTNITEIKHQLFSRILDKRRRLISVTKCLREGNFVVWYGMVNTYYAFIKTCKMYKTTHESFWTLINSSNSISSILAHQLQWFTLM